MSEHGIPCHRVGHGFTDRAWLLVPPGALAAAQICIYIERDGDYAAANRLLIELGAVIERPVPIRALAALAIVAGIILALITMKLEGKR